MIEATITIKNGKGEAKTYQLTQTAEAAKNKQGVMSKAHFQPAPDNKVILPFSKIYVDTEELSKKKS